MQVLAEGSLPPGESLAVVFPRRGEVSVQTVPIPNNPLGAREVLVRSEASIISAGTELASLWNLENQTSYPMRPGYGCIGRIELKGSDLPEFAIGQRVFFAGKHASLQRFTHGQGHQWGTLYPAPENMDARDAVFACMAQIAFIAPQVTQLTPGDTVAVFGLGLVGNLAAQLFQIAGARVLCLDPLSARGEIARGVDLQTVFSGAPNEQVQAVRELSGGKGAHVTVDAVGHSAVIANCVAATARFGQVILLGTPRAPHLNENVTPMLHRIHNEGLTVRGAHMWRLPPQDNPAWNQSVTTSLERVFGFIANGQLRVRELITHEASPHEAPAIYEGLQQRPTEFMGAVFDWSRA